MNLSKEHCLSLAKSEEGFVIGAGVPAMSEPTKTPGSKDLHESIQRLATMVGRSLQPGFTAEDWDIPIVLDAARESIAAKCDRIIALETELAEAKPWMLFFRDNKTLGEVAEAMGTTVYAFTQPMTRACTRICEDSEKESRRLREALEEVSEALRIALPSSALIDCDGNPNAPAWTLKSGDVIRLSDSMYAISKILALRGKGGEG